VAVEGLASHAGLPGDVRDRRAREAMALVQRDRRFDDPLPGLGLLIGSLSESVSARHAISEYMPFHQLTTPGLWL
jgi:hypothetical protein